MLNFNYLYNPPSLLWTLVIFKWETTSPLAVTYCPTWVLNLIYYEITFNTLIYDIYMNIDMNLSKSFNKNKDYLSLFVTFFESSSQTISGTGFPVALHFNETVGPGWRISSRKWNVNFGGSTRKINWYIKIFKKAQRY